MNDPVSDIGSTGGTGSVIGSGVSAALVLFVGGYCYCSRVRNEGKDAEDEKEQTQAGPTKIIYNINTTMVN